MSDTKPILCARCKVQVKVAPDPKPEDAVTCPSCGESDTFENVKRSLAQQAKEFVQRKLQKTMSDAFRGSSGIKYTPGVIEQHTHLFIVDLD